MAKESDPLAGALKTENTGLLSGLFAEENDFDRRGLWRLGTWGAAAVGAVILAVISNQFSLGWRREKVAAADLARQAEQLQSVAHESQTETRRLASAVETLNGDRDRLFSRVTVLEQGLDSVTGALARQNSAAAAAAISPAPQGPPVPQGPPALQASAAPSPPPPVAVPPPQMQAALSPPVLAPVATIPASLPAPEKPRGDAGKAASPVAISPAPAPNPSMTAAAASPPAVSSPAATASLMASKSIMGPPDPAAPKPIETAKPIETPAIAAPSPVPEMASVSQNPSDKSSDPPADKSPDKASEEQEPAASIVAVQRTEFAVDLGTANSIGGLRALWRGLTQSNAELAGLTPIIVVKEGNTGLGMQLRLAAGPLKDAATAAKICATLAESERPCETTVFDGQHLAMKGEDAQMAAGAKPLPGAKTGFYRHGAPKHAKKDDPPPAKPESSSTFSSLFSGLKH